MIQSHPAQISVSTWHYLVAATLALFVFFHFTASVLFSTRQPSARGLVPPLGSPCVTPAPLTQITTTEPQRNNPWEEGMLRS